MIEELESKIAQLQRSKSLAQTAISQLKTAVSEFDKTNSSLADTYKIDDNPADNGKINEMSIETNKAINNLNSGIRQIDTTISQLRSKIEEIMAEWEEMDNGTL